MQLEFPQRIYTDEASTIVYSKKIFYTTHDIQLWSLPDHTICNAAFVVKRRKWRRIKEEEMKQIIDHANNMNKLEKLNNDH